jgi:hypothetical protein
MSDEVGMRTVEEIRARLGDISIAEVLQACLADAQETSVEQFGPCGNLYIRPMLFPEAGSVVRGHTHNYDHLTIVFTGAVHLRTRKAEGAPKRPTKEYDLKAPAWVRIPKNYWHEFTALVPGTRADCVYALRDSDGVVTDVEGGRFDERCAG